MHCSARKIQFYDLDAWHASQRGVANPFLVGALRNCATPPTRRRHHPVCFFSQKWIISIVQYIDTWFRCNYSGSPYTGAWLSSICLAPISPSFSSSAHYSGCNFAWFEQLNQIKLAKKTRMPSLILVPCVLVVSLDEQRPAENNQSKTRSLIPWINSRFLPLLPLRIQIVGLRTDEWCFQNAANCSENEKMLVIPPVTVDNNLAANCWTS